MTIRLIALCLFLPTATLAQQAAPQECGSKQCPDGQIMDNATKACVPVSA